MAWREELRRVERNGRRYVGCSFRGVVFFVDEAQYESGRRLAEDDFPYSDSHFADDMGREAREFPIVGYVIGDDYLQEKLKLIDALEAYGPGELTHPYYGKNLSVRVKGKFQISERRSEGRIARVNVTFQLAEDEATLEISAVASVPSVTEQARAQLAVAYQAQAAANAVDGDFLAPIENAVKGFAAKVRAPFEAVAKSAQKSAQFRSRLNSLVDDAVGIVADPIAITESIGAVLANSTFAPPALPSSLVALINLAARLFDELTGENEVSSPFDTETRQKQAILLKATAEFLASSVALTVADLCSGASYESYDDALTVRETLGETLDARASEPGFEDAQSSFEQVRSITLKTIPRNEEGNFLRQFFTPSVNTPSVVLAYRFYGSSAHELRLVARNKEIQHPGFVRGARAIEVLREL